MPPGRGPLRRRARARPRSRPRAVDAPPARTSARTDSASAFAEALSRFALDLVAPLYAIRMWLTRIMSGVALSASAPDGDDGAAGRSSSLHAASGRDDARTNESATV